MAAEHAPAKRPAPSRASTAAQLELYSPRLRRAMITYLRLRLLELREAGLERARAAIERRLSIDEMLGTPRSQAPAGAAREAPRDCNTPCAREYHTRAAAKSPNRRSDDFY